MFYSGEHGTILNLNELARAQHAPDLSYIILFMRDGNTFTLRDGEARRCAQVLARRCDAASDGDGAVLLDALANGVREITQVRRLAGAGGR